MACKWGLILTTYKSWDDPPSTGSFYVVTNQEPRFRRFFASSRCADSVLPERSYDLSTTVTINERIRQEVHDTHEMRNIDIFFFKWHFSDIF